MKPYYQQRDLRKNHLVGLDLHSNNVCGIVANENDRWVLKRKFPINLHAILSELESYRSDIGGIVVEATATWYWLVDGLRDAGYNVHLANPTALDDSRRKKRSGDFDDAFKLIKLLRTGDLPEAYIYPKEERPIRDLMRKRAFLVRSRTQHKLSLMNLIGRNNGQTLSSNQINQLLTTDIEELFQHRFLQLSADASLSVINHLTKEIKIVEKAVLEVGRLKPEFKRLEAFPGIGEVIALTIALELGTLSRFGSVGNYLSYCRCVDSMRLSNGKKKGENNKKNGNKYLSWAYVEAANFAKRYCPYARAYFNYKLKESRLYVKAIKSLASKISRATYCMMTRELDYDPEKVFGRFKADAHALMESKSRGSKPARGSGCR